MSKFRRFLILLCIFSLVIINNKGYVVYATVPQDFVGPLLPGTVVDTTTDESNTPTGGTTNSGTLSEDEGKQILANIMGSNGDVTPQYNTLCSIYAALKSSSYSSNEAISAILVNLIRESMLNSGAAESGNWEKGVGLVQWTSSGRKGGLEQYATNNCKGAETKCSGCTMISGHKLPCVAHQIAYLIIELEGGEWMSIAPTKYTDVVNNLSTITADINDANIDLSKGVSIETWRDMRNVTAMTLYFTSCFERCDESIEIYSGAKGAKYAKNMLTLVNGLETGQFNLESDQQLNQGLAEALVNSGIWDEDRLSEFCRLTETNVQADLLDKAKRNNLSNEELYNLSNWEDNVRKDAENTGLIKIVRIITMFVGIIFTLWVILIYIAYWFDRINNFVDIDLVGILTLGKLRVSDTEEECTFKVSTLNHSEKKTVNHRAMVFICLTGVLFGVLIISGTFYKFLQVFVLKIFDILS